MATHRRVSPKFWQDPKVRRWNDQEKLLAQYLMTCSHRTTEGLFWLPVAYVANDLGWSFEGASKVLQSLVEDGFAAYDDASETVLLVKALKYQAPAGANQIQGAMNALAEVPPTPLFALLSASAATFAPEFAEALDAAMKEGVLKVHGSTFEGASKGYRPSTPTPTPSPAPTPTRAETDAAPTGNQPSAAPSAPKRTPPDGFLDWWAGYPRKIGRAEAEAAFAKALKRGATLDLLVKTLTASREQWQRENRPTDKVPHAATWLNKERWRDEPEPAKAAVSYETPKVVYP